jgi:outer membrane protein assembly factor BamB
VFFTKIKENKKNMQFSRNKTLAIMIAILLTVSMAASVVFVPQTSAHTPPQQLTTNAYIAALPSPIGLGQSTLIYMWLNRVYGYYPVGEPAGSINYAAVNNNYRFHNYKLTITDPNGAITTKTFDTIQDTTSSQSYSFTPTIVGTYTLTFDFPGQTITTTNGSPISVAVNDTYLPSTATTTLTVQQDPIPTYPGSYPLPQEYWTRPIYGENPFWWAISSNWLGTGQPSAYGGIIASYNAGANGNIYYAGDTVGPQTSHIMWTKPFQTGGIVGGNKFAIQGNAYFEGSAYNQRYQNPIVINGKIYYNEPISFTGANAGPLDCVDLRTGQLIWSRPDLPQMSFALIWDHEDPNQHGVFPAILSTANFARLFDAETGASLFNVTGVPTATAFQVTLGPNGEQLRTIFSNLGNTTNPNWVIAEWNSTKLWTMGTNPFTGGSLLSPSIINASNNVLTTVPLSPSSATFATTTYVVNGGVLNSSDPQNRFDWNYSIGWRNTMPNTPTVVGIIPGDIMLCYNGTLPSQGATFMGTLGFSPYTYFTVNLNASKGTIGNILWMKNYDPPANNVTVLEAGIDPVNRVFVEDLRETQTYVGYSIDTGAKLWTTEPQADMDYYGSQSSGSLANTFAYGRLYSGAYSGITYCYDTKTGNRLWTYGNGGAGNTTDSGFEAPGHYPTFVNAIGNDVVYLVTSEHTVEMPIYKGGLARAINATTGAEIWTLSDYTTEFSTTSYAVADGYATWYNSYDDSVYTVGRGPTAITVQAPQAAIDLGRSLVITGNVKDTAAGTQQKEQIARFPNGVPLSSDASMTEWMAYIYQQKPLPNNFTGVQVTLDVIDSNGNYRNIGSATTDASGAYSYHWTPDISGAYTVIATFHGTNGYWPSYTETSFAVDSAHPTAVPTQALPTNLATTTDLLTYLAIGVIAIIIAIAIVGMLLLRKHP